MAESVKKGAEKTGASVKIFQVEETLPSEVLTKMNPPPKSDYPLIRANDLVKADGLIFGLPTRFGSAPAQMKALMDSCGSLWVNGSLKNKMAALFTSTSSQHGGIETTALTFLTQLVHLGIIFVPLGYSHPAINDVSEINGSSPYGSGTITGADGKRFPSKTELAIAEHQGEHFATVVHKFIN